MSIAIERHEISTEAERMPPGMSIFDFPSERPQTRGRALVVEDNPINQRVIVQMIEKRGFKSDVASNGLEAVEMLSRAAYDLVLMDCQMPVMDGYEATSQIRQMEGSSRHTPIIAVTANAMVGDREKCLSAGMDDYLSKPVKIEALEEMLNRWCADEQKSRAVASPSSKIENDILDMSAIESLRELQGDGEDDLFREIVEIYIADAPAYIADISLAVESANAAAIERAAHTLKGSSASLGAHLLASACLEMEKLGRSGSLTGAGELLARI
ncbi:MAG: response regulator [Acidobacteriota bacterium]